jgi:hypothetical protein
MSGSNDDTIENIEENAIVYQNRPTPEHIRDLNQAWCVLSIVCPKGTNQRCSDSMIKVYGCRSSRQSADDFAKIITKDNPYYDIFVMPTSEWGVIPPVLAEIDEVYSNDERIQRIFDEFKNERIGNRKELEQKLEIAHARKKEAPKIELLES